MRRNEAGFTIAELAIGSALMLVVTTAALFTLNSASRATRFSTKETQTVDDAQVAIDRMVTEIRQSASVQPATPSCPAATCLIYTTEVVGGGTTGVRWTYNSATSTLYRATGDPLTNAWGADRIAATGVVNGGVAVFCRAAPCTVPSETAIQILLIVNAEPSKPLQVVRLQSYATPRNL